MPLYRHGSPTVYDVKIHLVWCTKYRQPILTGRLALRVRDLVREICAAQSVQILKGHVAKDHLHLFLSVPPPLSLSRLAQYLKGKTSRQLLQEVPTIRKMFWGQHVWARGYFVVSSGTITDEVIMEYIAHQEEDREKRGDQFTVVDT